MKTAVVIPAFNEARTLGEVIDSVRQFVDAVFVVDDCSADRSGAQALAHGAIVVKHVLNRGQGAALRTGLSAALASGAEAIVTFDADGQMEAADIPRLLAPLKNGEVEAVLGSRFLGQAPGMPWPRRLVLKVAVIFTRLTTGLKITDAHNGLRAFSRSAAAALELKQDRMAHASEILSEIARLKLKYIEAPVTVRYTPQILRKGQKLSNALRIIFELVVKRLVQ